jgi:hypothetical protein
LNRPHDSDGADSSFLSLTVACYDEVISVVLLSSSRIKRERRPTCRKI